MGVNPLPTGGIYKYFTFDGETSASFGVHLTGEGVYNAPERAVEMISIPARNGAFALDQGRFENIEVEYTASIVADNESDFRTAVSEFRNFLCSKTGYCRLEDDYNPNEYRMAVYKSGLEVDPFTLRTGEFSIVFDCKPQRFLKSGETAISVTSGDTITNPTRFDAQPLLEVEGYGNIYINEDATGTYVGDRGSVSVKVLDKKSWNGADYSLTQSVEIDDTLLTYGDRIYSDKRGDDICDFAILWDCDWREIQFVSAEATGYARSQMGTYYGVGFLKSAVQFQYGVPQTYTGTSTFYFTSIEYGELTGSISLSLAYDGDRTFTLSASYITPSHMTDRPSGYRLLLLNNLYADATVLSRTYIDFDIGEAYGVVGGELVAYNDKVSFPADLPTLKSGANTITYDNTFTSFKVVPRWWQV